MKEHISLKPYNTFSIDVMARYFTSINSVESLEAILSDQRWKIIPYFILGGGSNILFTKDFDGLVIHNHILGIEKIKENNDHIYLKVGAGENWHQFVLYCIQNNYAGVENLSLIPGTVGAAPIQNIGAYGVEVKDVLHEVHTIAVNNLSHHVFFNADCQFDYRDSIFKNQLKNQHVITHVIFKLNKTPIFHTHYGQIKEKLRGRKLSIKAISDVIIKIRQEKLPDPKIISNAGSFFKNPFISRELLLLLKKKYADIPYFSEQYDHIKIPAGWLIEHCGFKGRRVGDVGVHEHQALVLVNFGNGTGIAIKKLSETIQQTVLKRFNIQLLPEVNIM